MSKKKSRMNRKKSQSGKRPEPTATDVIKILFDALNEAFFDEALPTPDFYVGRTLTLNGVETMGSYSSPDQGPNFGRHDIFFNPRMHQGVIEGRWMTATVETLLHEMVHFWYYMQHIDDGDGIYHNEAFRDAAMAHGLDCRHQDSLGWQLTVVRPSTWFIRGGKRRDGAEGRRPLAPRAALPHRPRNAGSDRRPPPPM